MARDTNFYYSFLVLPPEKRRAIVAVWDFCRVVDDATDEVEGRGVESVRAEVRRWRRELALAFEGGSPETPQAQALVPVIPAFHLPRESFEDLIDGVEMDVFPRRYETFDELYEYCVRVASAVGLICLEIFGYSQPSARQYAVDLGVALQLTNILRDVSSDLGRGRVYIPLRDLAAHGCSEQDLAYEAAHSGHGIRRPAVRAVLMAQAGRARDYYRRAERALPRVDARRLVAAEIMGGIYKGILDRIEARDYDVFSSVVRIPRPRRAWLAATIWLRTLVRL